MGLIAGHMKALGVDNAAPVLEYVYDLNEQLVQGDKKKFALNIEQFKGQSPHFIRPTYHVGLQVLTVAHLLLKSAHLNEKGPSQEHC